MIIEQKFFHPPEAALKAADGFYRCLERKPESVGHGHGGGRVINIVPAGNGDKDLLLLA
jgi:hypothetical protein